MPHNWKCRSRDSQALWFPARLWLAGLWTPCRFIWADGAGGTQEHWVTLLSQESWSWGAVLSGLTVLWNDVNEALIISNKWLKKFSAVGDVSICTAQGSALPVFPATCLGNYPWTGWQPPCDSQSLGGTRAVLQALGARAAQGSCRQCLGPELAYRSTDSEMAIIFIIFWFHKEVFMWE